MVLACGRRVPIEVRRHARSRRFVLRVSGGVIQLTIPTRARLRDALAWAEGQRAFVEDQLGREPAPVPLAMGATVPVLGSDRKVVPGLLTTGSLLPGRLEIAPAATDVLARRIEARLRDAVLEAATADLEGFWKALGVPIAAVTVRSYRRRWGACAADGRTAINWRLVFAPREVLAYVCAHEAAHRVEMNHGPGFWETVESLMPGFRAEAAWLKAHGSGLAAYGHMP